MTELDPRPFVWLGATRRHLREGTGRTDIPLDKHYPELFYGFAPRIDYEQDRAKYPL